MSYLLAEWGYDRYPGVCHIIPNAGVCALSLLYGEGDFSRTIEIATMCGWDTDCNAGNVGTILGVKCGLEGINRQYRDPTFDTIIVSGIAGSLNMIDVLTYVKELAYIACTLNHEPLPGGIIRPKANEVLLDFELPGATHGIRLSDNYANFVLRQTTEISHTGKGCLEIVFEHLMPYTPSNIYWKPFYRRKDFDDERYSPVFSPVAYSGQHVQLFANLELLSEGEVYLTPYVRLSMQDKELTFNSVKIVPGEWTPLSFILPDSNGDVFDEIGVKLSSHVEGRRVYGRLFIDDFCITGSAKYRVDMSLQKIEFDQVTPFSFNQCNCGVESGWLDIYSQERAQAFTGNYFAHNEQVSSLLCAEKECECGLILRGQGAQRYYALGFGGTDTVSIAKYIQGRKTILAQASFPWHCGDTYLLCAQANGTTLSLMIDGTMVLQTSDDSLEYGMIGYYIGEIGGTIHAKDFCVIAD